MKLHIPPRLASILTLGLLALLGTFLLLKTPLSTGASNGGASLAQAALFGINTVLLGILIWRMTPSLTAGLVIAGLFITSGEMLQVHASSLFDALFIFLSLLSFWAFDLYFERPPSTTGKGVAGEWWWLVAAGLFAGMAYYIHYAGLALVITFTAALLVLRTSWRKRFTSVGIFLAGILPLTFPWPLHNRLVSANVTSARAWTWHPIALGDNHAGIVEILIILAAILVLFWGLRQTWIYMTRSPRFPQGHRSDREAREVISYTNSIYIVASLVYAVFFNPGLFEYHILMPMIVGLLILLAALGIWMRNRNRTLVIVVTILVLAFSIYRQAVTAAKLSEGTGGQQSQHELNRNL